MVNDFQVFDLAFKGVLGAFDIFISIYLVLERRSNKRDQRFKEIDERIEELDSDIDQRFAINARNAHADIGGLYNRVNRTAEDVGEMRGELRGINDNLRMILTRIAEKGIQ